MRPPALAHWLLERVLPAGVRSASIRGDLLEEMRERAARHSARAAARWYWRQALVIALRTVIHREPGKASLMDAFTLDVRFALRSLLATRGARGVTAVAVLTLALGIGASTAVFSVVNAVLMRPLPIAEPDRVMWLIETNRNGGLIPVAWPTFHDWRKQLTSFEDVAASRAMTFNVTGGAGPERVEGRQVTWGFLRVLGVTPVIGRTFAEAEDVVGAGRVAIISNGLWRRRFSADSLVLGQVMTINAESYQIVGVLPAGFSYAASGAEDLFLLLGQHATEDSGLLDRGNHNGLTTVGRLRAGATRESAATELAVATRALAAAYPATNAGIGATMMPLTERLVGSVEPTLMMVFGAVAILLLLAIANVASLLVARGVARRHELSVRAALGCGKWRLARQLLVESGILAGVGGVTGIAVAFGLVQMLIAAAPPDLPRLSEIQVDTAALLFALLTSATVSLLLGIFPAFQSSGVRGSMALVRAGRDSVAHVSSLRIRRALMVVEVAFAVVLLVGAGLMTRTMHELGAVSTGFDPGNLLTLRLNVPAPPGTGDNSDERHFALYTRILDNVRALPGVEHAALAQTLPIEGAQWNSNFIVSGHPVPAREDLPSAAFSPVSSGYVETMKMSVRAGRVFTEQDTASAGMVAMVNDTFARRFWPDGNAVGQRIKQGWPENPTPWREIVGVVGDVKINGVDSTTPLEVFLPASQEAFTSIAVIVRSRSAGALTKPVSAAVQALVPDVPLYNVRTMEDLMGAAVSRQRVTMRILGGFAGIALLLACVGLYGVVSHDVSERTREIGVRLALGATRGRVVWLFVGQGLLTTAIGLAIGVGGALSLAQWVRGLLFNVSATDPATFWVTGFVLLTVALLACYLPARRASRVSPTVALRGE